MNHSLAAVFEGDAGRVTLRELRTPEPRAREVLTRVLGCTLCASDLHSYEGRRAVPVPTVLGHEAVGEVVAFGESALRVDSGDRELRIGDRMAWAIVAHRGQCAMCERGLPQKCLRAVKYGHEAFTPGRELLGGLADTACSSRGLQSQDCPRNCRSPWLARRVARPRQWSPPWRPPAGCPAETCASAARACSPSRSALWRGRWGQTP